MVEAAHSARSWLGHNAIHDAGGVLALLAAHEPRRVVVDGLEYREGLNAVAITGGIAGNVIPDRCTVTVNFRFAPDRSVEQAEQYCREVLAGYELVFTDAAPAARPGLDLPAAQDFLAALGGEVGGFFFTDTIKRLVFDVELPYAVALLAAAD